MFSCKNRIFDVSWGFIDEILEVRWNLSWFTINAHILGVLDENWNGFVCESPCFFSLCNLKFFFPKGFGLHRFSECRPLFPVWPLQQQRPGDAPVYVCMTEHFSERSEQTLTAANLEISSSDAPSDAKPISWLNWANSGSARRGTCPSNSWHKSGSGV